MKSIWSNQELEEHWFLESVELALIANKKPVRNRLGFALLLKFFQLENRFPSSIGEIPPGPLKYVAGQLNTHAKHLDGFVFDGRTANDHHTDIRNFTGWRGHTAEDGRRLTNWLTRHVLPDDPESRHLTESALTWYREQHIEPPPGDYLDRLIRTSVRTHEDAFFATIHACLSEKTKHEIDGLLSGSDAEPVVDVNIFPPSFDFNELKADPGRPGLESVLREVAKLKRIDQLGFPADLFGGQLAKYVTTFRRRVATEPPSELKLRVEPVRYTMVAAFCWQRRREILDGLVDLLIQIVHRIGVKADKRVEKELLENFRKVRGKAGVLFKMAEAAVDHPDGVIKDVLYPLVGVQTLKDLVKEFKTTGTAFQLVVHTIMRASYSSHYRRMLPPILDALPFRSNNAAHRPVIEALELVRSYRDNRSQYFPTGKLVPIDGVVAPKWQEIVQEADKDGNTRINRINYEICVLQAVREGLRSKEIWIDGSDRFRNPDEDLPGDFEAKREDYYAALDVPREAKEFIDALKTAMNDALSTLDKGIPKNPNVKILERGKNRISITPLDEQAEPKNLAALKAEILARWSATSLLDVLKEAEFRIGFTQQFQTSASRATLDRDTLQRRLLLCLHGMGTNAGLKRMLNGDGGTTYKELLYTRRRFIQKASLRNAIAQIVNAVFAARLPDIWGEGTTACASDSKKFGAWDQNLMTEWHIRYGGRGVMIYWHVERKSVCIYSQLKRCSSSEVAAMIEGVLRHCTDMEVEKNYVDSHGQSEVAFAFSNLLGFDLLPRLKAIASQKLYIPAVGDAKHYLNLEPVLSRPIQWDLIAQQYDEMIKYATALRIGSADPESILRRFTRGNIQHPTYRALAELGKAVKTVFLCRYIHAEELRREIHEGLNVVENWNSANSFIFYGKGGEVASNQLEDQELSVLSLHLVQICLVYVNTLMIQRILSDTGWRKRLKTEDLRALSPLIYAHINPYGRFDLDMNTRLPIDEPV